MGRLVVRFLAVPSIFSIQCFAVSTAQNSCKPNAMELAPIDWRLLPSHLGHSSELDGSRFVVSCWGAAEFRTLSRAKLRIYFEITSTWGVKNEKWNGLSNCKLLYSMLANCIFARTVLLICQLFSYHQKAAEIALKRPENGPRSLP